MQPNEITLAVDLLNTGATTDETLSRFDEYNNRTVYIGENHNVNGPKELLTLYRTFPKVNGNFMGTSKVAFKFSYDHGVLGADGVTTIQAPFILEISASVPVGVTDAQALVMRQRALALLDLDSVMLPLFSQLSI